MRALLALLLMARPMAAQELLDDKDFTFSLTLPPGLLRLADEQVAEMRGKSLDEVVNVPRAESPGSEIGHSYFWDDPTVSGREASLVLADGAPPFGDPEQLVEFAEKEFGMKVDFKEPLRPPAYASGIRVEGARTSKQGIEVRATIAYYILSSEPLRWGLLRLQAPTADWEANRAEFLQAIASVKYPLPKQGGAGTAPGATTQRRRAPQEPSESWATLEVTGSLVLAAVLLMSLFFGGRGNP